MQKANKYNAKPLFYCQTSGKIFEDRQNDSNLFFASTFEYRVYKCLREVVDPKLIHLQVPLLIKHASKKYPAIFWRCDFRVYRSRNTTNEYLNIEAKGEATKEFKRALKYLEWFSHNDYERLLIVSDTESAKIDSHFKALSTSSLGETLKKLGYGSISSI